MAEQDEDDNFEPRKFDHAVYKEISLTNGKINKMKKEKIKQSLASFDLDTRWERKDRKWT